MDLLQHRLYALSVDGKLYEWDLQRRAQELKRRFIAKRDRQNGTLKNTAAQPPKSDVDAEVTMTTTHDDEEYEYEDDSNSDSLSDPLSSSDTSALDPNANVRTQTQNANVDANVNVPISMASASLNEAKVDEFPTQSDEDEKSSPQIRAVKAAMAQEQDH